MSSSTSRNTAIEAVLPVESAPAPLPTSVPNRNRLVAGFGWACLSILIFSGWFVVTRLGVSHELRIWDITALRFGIGAIVLAPVAFRRRPPLPRAAWRAGFIYMVLWGAPFVLFVALGLALTSARHAASITPTLMPVFAGALAWLFAGEQQGKIRWIGYATIVLGLLLLLGADAWTRGLPNFAGVAALTAAAAMWAVYTLLFKRSGLTAAQAAAVICVWSSAIYLPPYFILGISQFALASPSELILQVVYQGVLMSGVAIVVFNRAVTILGPSAATSIVALVPVMATILAAPILGEIPSALEAIAIGLVVAGALFAARPRTAGTVEASGAAATH